MVKTKPDQLIDMNMIQDYMKRICDDLSEGNIQYLEDESGKRDVAVLLWEFVKRAP